MQSVFIVVFAAYFSQINAQTFTPKANWSQPLERSFSSLSLINVTIVNGVLAASIQAEFFQKFSKTRLSLDLFSMDGRLLNRFSLAETNQFYLSNLPTAAYWWGIRAGEQTLKFGKIIR